MLLDGKLVINLCSDKLGEAQEALLQQAAKTLRTPTSCRLSTFETVEAMIRLR